MTKRKAVERQLGWRVELVPLEDVQEAARNPRKHSQSVAASISKFGFAEPLLRDERTGRLVAGHGRLKALRESQGRGEKPPQGIESAADGRWLVPVVAGWSSRDDAHAEALLIASNQTAHAGGWEEDDLVAILRDLQNSVPDLGAVDLGFDDASLDELLKEVDVDASAAERIDVEHNAESTIDRGDAVTGSIPNTQRVAGPAVTETRIEPEESAEVSDGEEDENPNDSLPGMDGPPPPFPWFGGKRRVAGLVWQALGDAGQYVEPFAGSLAVLLGRPQEHEHRCATVNDLDAYVCVAPGTRILMRDLTYRRAGDLREGDALLAFDEENPGEARSGLRAPTAYRKWRHSVVIANPVTSLPCWRLTFDDGTEVVASENHQWLSGSHTTGSGGRGWRWVSTKSLVVREKQRSWVLKAAPLVDREESWESGWLAGIFDGEGNVFGPPGLRVSMAQNSGAVLAQAERLLSARGFSFKTSGKCGSEKGKQLVLGGGSRDMFRFLMLTRPTRLLRNLDATVEGISLYGRQHSAVGLISKEFIGKREVVALATSTRTFVAEGLASHNCNFWRALAAAPDEVAQHADWPVNETDLFARHAWLVNAGRERIAKLEADPEHYDAKVAGWWVWGLCCWIGSGWCSGTGPHRPGQGDEGLGVNRKLPHLGDGGRGVNRPGGLVDYMRDLAARLRSARVCCGDWQRVLTRGALTYGGTVGVFLDPPYLNEVRTKGCYNTDANADDLSHQVREWALAAAVEHGDRLRIVLAGYEPEHEAHMPAAWRRVKWRSLKSAYGSTKNRDLERLWFSPSCLPVGRSDT